MKTERPDIERIAAYFAGHLSDAEKADVEAWANISFENKERFAAYAKVWESSGIKFSHPADDTDQQWLRLKTRLNKKEIERKIFSLPGPLTLLKIAAGIILLIGLSYIFIGKPEITLQETSSIIVSSGEQVASVYLPDSTQVWLNVNSTLTYSKDYNKMQNRQTKLSGEGYFKVHRDGKRTFNVITENARIRVLGTSFNVKQDTHKTILTVSSGSVKFTPESSKENPVIVNAHEKAVCDQRGNIKKTKNDDLQFANWRLKDNPVYLKESESPSAYLNNDFTWRKNMINQSVIEGTLKNSASLAAYQHITLRVTYTKSNGRKVTTRIRLNERIAPGETIHYQKRLMDVLTNIRSLEVKVESAVVLGNH